jgi:hypothetical protein
MSKNPNLFGKIIDAGINAGKDVAAGYINSMVKAAAPMVEAVAPMAGAVAPMAGAMMPQQGYPPMMPQQGYPPMMPQQGYPPMMPQQGYSPQQSYQMGPYRGGNPDKYIKCSFYILLISLILLIILIIYCTTQCNNNYMPLPYFSNFRGYRKKQIK